jgi:hypothetical protein
MDSHDAKWGALLNEEKNNLNPNKFSWSNKESKGGFNGINKLHTWCLSTN